jgi:hypothetical protein
MRIVPLLRAAPLVAIVLAAAARAAPQAAACHCFTNRTFDPEQPAAADPYVLATARSSLLSAAFSVGKALLVQEVMSGTNPDDLWVAYWAGAKTGRGAEALLAARGRSGSWKAAFGKEGARGAGETFHKALARGAPASELAAVAVDDVLVTRMGADPAVVAALRRAGAGNSEAVLATLLAPRLRLPATEVLARFRSGSVSWGMLLDAAGMKPKEIDAVVRQGIR